MTNEEINFLIAEKIMGYRIIPPSVHEDTGFKNSGYFVVKEANEIEDEIWINQFEFCPTTDIKDAWLVVEKLNKRWEFELYKDNSKEEPYYCDFSGYDKFAYVDRFYRGVAKSAPMAICKSALKSIEINVD